eukprot:COSAG01_NODE_21956_length_877_cov_3083.939589_1_plen_37_part_10
MNPIKIALKPYLNFEQMLVYRPCVARNERWVIILPSV